MPRALNLPLVFVLSAALFFCQNLAYGSLSSPYTDHLEKQLAEHPTVTMDEFLGTLPEAWRSNYLLIYQSNSIQSASLARPRVVLHSPDRHLLLAFSDGSGSRPDDQAVEIIESYGLQPPRFSQVTWNNGQSQMIRDPAKCASCHQGAPIFEPYPNWPGFFGSTHDGRYYGEPTGTGGLARLEVEEQALATFAKNAPNLPRYHQMLQLESASVSTQALQNLFTGAVMIEQLNERQNDQIYRSLRSVSELHDAYVMSYPLQPSVPMTPPSFYSEFQSDSRYASYREFMAKELQSYDDEVTNLGNVRFDAFKSFIGLDGTAQDQQTFSVARPFSYVDSYRPGYQPYPPVRTDLGLPVPEIMNYFEDKDNYRYPGLYYTFWRSNHSRAKPLPMNNGFQKTSVRYSTGMDSHSFLSSNVIEFEGQTSNGAYTPVGPVSYESFEELYEWVPRPLKQYSWTELSSDPVLSQQVDAIQKGYLGILMSSPYLSTTSPKVFRRMKSWSPENRNQLEQIIRNSKIKKM